MRQLIKLLFFWIIMFSSSAQAQLGLDFVLPVPPPDGRERIPHGPDRTGGGLGGAGDLYFGECGPVTYRCNFLHGDGFNRIMREAQTNHRLSLQSFRSSLNKSMSALDQDLENWRNGNISGNSALAERLRANVETLEDYRLRRIELSENLQRLEEEERERIRQMIEDMAPSSPQPDLTGPQGLVRELAEGRLRLDIEHTRERADLVENQVRNFSDYVPERMRLVRAGRFAADVAEQALSESDFDKSQFALDFAKGTLDLAVSLTPGVGWARDVYEAISGVDLMSGEELTTFERSMAILGAVTGGIGSKIGTGVKMINKGIDAVTDASKVAGSAGDVGRAADGARKVVESASKHGIDLRKMDVERFKNNPLSNTEYSPKVQIQMKSGDYHAFPKEVDNFAGLGQRNPLVGGDGITRTKIDLPGTYDGKQGHFEWIIEADNKSINHRLFVPQR